MVSWSEFPGLHSRGRQCGRKEAILGGADKPAYPHRKGGPHTLYLDPSFPGNGGPSLTQSTCGSRRRGELVGFMDSCCSRAFMSIPSNSDVKP